MSICAAHARVNDFGKFYIPKYGDDELSNFVNWWNSYLKYDCNDDILFTFDFDSDNFIWHRSDKKLSYLKSKFGKSDRRSWRHRLKENKARWFIKKTTNKARRRFGKIEVDFHLNNVK